MADGICLQDRPSVGGIRLGRISRAADNACYGELAKLAGGNAQSRRGTKV